MNGPGSAEIKGQDSLGIGPLGFQPVEIPAAETTGLKGGVAHMRASGSFEGSKCVYYLLHLLRCHTFFFSFLLMHFRRECASCILQISSCVCMWGCGGVYDAVPYYTLHPAANR